MSNVNPEDISIDLKLKSHKTAEIVKYFSQIDEIREMKANRNYMFIGKYIKLLCKSGYARSSFGEIFRIKLVMMISSLIEKRRKKRWQFI